MERSQWWVWWLPRVASALTWLHSIRFFFSWDICMSRCMRIVRQRCRIRDYVLLVSSRQLTCYKMCIVKLQRFHMCIEANGELFEYRKLIYLLLNIWPFFFGTRFMTSVLEIPNKLTNVLEISFCSQPLTAQSVLTKSMLL